MVVNDIKWVTPNATRPHRRISKTRESNYIVNIHDISKIRLIPQRDKSYFMLNYS